MSGGQLMTAANLCLEAVKRPFHGVNQNTANRQISCLLQLQQPIVTSDFHRRHFELQKCGHF